MISHIDGVVAEVREAALVLQAGAFGLEIFAPKATLMACGVGEAVRVHTVLVVREDALSLYGFHEQDLLTLFTHLTSVSGIGPKLALSILSSMPASVLAAGILQGDAGLLASAPGVGKKTAERIILELRNRLPEHLMAPAGGATRPTAALSEAGADAVQALLALGYRETQVKAAVAELAFADPEASAETLIRKALSKLR